MAIAAPTIWPVMTPRVPVRDSSSGSVRLAEVQNETQLMTVRLLTGAVLSLLLSLGAAADVIKLREPAPERYVVVEGDTLWDIAGKFLAHPWQWPQVWQDNPQIKNPHLIYPGDELTLVETNGVPRISLTRSRLVKLSPQIRSSAHVRAIPLIPLDAIAAFLSRPRVLTESELNGAGYVVGGQDEHLVNGAGHRIYLRNLSPSPTGRYMVFRAGREYRDPDTGQVLGREALQVADLRLEREGDPATGIITASNREVIKGDRLLPFEDLSREASAEFESLQPRAPTNPIEGRLIAVVDGVTQIGQLNTVVINRGADAGLEPGHVLAIFQAGAEVKDPLATPATKVRLPEERAGEVVVFRVFGAVSFALVMNTQRPVHVLDHVRNP